jgi:hypothetical protein
MNYDLEFLEAAGIRSEPQPEDADRRARAIFWRIVLPLLAVFDVLLIILMCKLLSFFLR